MLQNKNAPEGTGNMDQIMIGKFIARRRKEKNLTQAQLAEMLNISDRAVSKWERGLNLPDPSLMLPLCEIMGITADELLNGCESEKGTADACEEAEEISAAPEKKAENKRAASTVVSVIFSSVLAVGVLILIICNIAISGSLTWSLIPIASMAYGWAIIFPGLAAGKRKLIASLVSVSVFTVPYLYLLSVLTGVHAVFVIGTAAAAASLIFLWIIAAVFTLMGKTRIRTAFGISFLLAVPFEISLNLLLCKMIDEPLFDMWDMLTMFVFLIIAFACFAAKKEEKSGR